MSIAIKLLRSQIKSTNNNKVLEINKSENMELSIQIALGGIGAVALLCLLGLSMLLPKQRGNNKSEKDALKHVLITGGSSGIGLACAKECVRRKAPYVTIVARNKKKLEDAKTMLDAYAKETGSNTVVSFTSVDVTDYKAIEAVAPSIMAEEKGGAPTVLLNSAGVFLARKILDTPMEEFEKMMNMNYLGIVRITKIFLPHLKPGACIHMVSSAAGQLGCFAYTSYSASKFALKGFAEALQMEVSKLGINVVMSHPPDTVTPGFEEELKGKPEELAIIAESAKLMQPEDVAKTIISSCCMCRPPFTCYFGFEGWMLSTVTAGFSPVVSLFDFVSQVMFMGVLRIVGVYMLADWRNQFDNFVSKDSGKEKAA